MSFKLFWVVTSAHSYSSIYDKFRTFYVSSSCLSTTIKLADTKEQKVEETADIIYYLSTKELLN